MTAIQGAGNLGAGHLQDCSLSFTFTSSQLRLQAGKTGLLPFPQSSLLGTKSEKEERRKTPSAVAQPRRGCERRSLGLVSPVPKRDSRRLAVLNISMRDRDGTTGKQDKGTNYAPSLKIEGELTLFSVVGSGAVRGTLSGRLMAGCPIPLLN